MAWFVHHRATKLFPSFPEEQRENSANRGVVLKLERIRRNRGQSWRRMEPDILALTIYPFVL